MTKLTPFAVRVALASRPLVTPVGFEPTSQRLRESD